MRIKSSSIYYLMAWSLFLGIILSIIPLPDFFRWFRPPWIALILFYWSIYEAEKVNIFLVWLLGLFLDQLFSSPLGAQAFALVLVVYIGRSWENQLAIMSVWQQTLFLMPVLALYQISLLIIRGFVSPYVFAPQKGLFPILTGMALWFFVQIFLSQFRRRYQPIGKRFL